MPVTTSHPDVFASIIPDETYPIQNEHRGPSCYTHGGPNSAEQYQWAGKGDPEGGDVQYIPGSVIRSPGFRRIMSRGLYSFADPEVDHLSYQGQVWIDSFNNTQEAALSQLEDDDEAELESFNCVGPGPRNSGSLCGEASFMRRKDLETTPPLCARHKEKYSKYFERTEDGTWQRISPAK